MRLHDGEAEEAFRAEFVAWLEANAPSAQELDTPRESSADFQDWSRAWQRRLFDAGWLVPGWPPELGGRDATPVQQMIYFEELSKRHVSRSVNPQGLGIVAPSLLDYGTPEQRERFLLPTLRAEIAWCIGMSEPGAGSDLAGLSTRAVLDGDHFLVNGQKVWTSGAHQADWCLCFVRTDPDVPKHRGISVLIVDMRSAGIEARPFPELTDPTRCDFNEVFFTDVVVPRDHLLGELNGGWPISQGSLAHERAMLWIDSAYSLQRAVGVLVETGQREGPGGHGTYLADDDGFRDQVASLYIDAQAIMLMGYRGFSKYAKGKANPEHSLLKLFGGEAIQRCCLVGTEAIGAAAVDDDVLGPTLLRPASWATQYLLSFNGTIPGGTSEIQRNIIAERVLGLPRR
jgi:alkylation response protein AidB-like acyl-CoA dehydrogenase